MTQNNPFLQNKNIQLTPPLCPFSISPITWHVRPTQKKRSLDYMEQTNPCRLSPLSCYKVNRPLPSSSPSRHHAAMWCITNQALP
ncbi:hypothetical protein JOQ06_016558 [Pogonophryne albipinna]|uniref:Uncharacterized protein n=1 Tax=Pogonophryne albipinna TaxID=1090488 RepID=A0AAD6ACZ4_9TELE|nr:hypothetical protein JOQ06_016558 [Pogonophryne albipinna]